MPVKSLAVFCGSKNGTSPIFSQHAARLGKLLAENNIKLIYGGGSAGLMGVVADNAMEHGGQVTGIIPKLLVEWEKQHRGITELITADNMHDRKKLLYSLCDAALVLPGGFGTLDELFEIVTWNQLTIHDKDIFILNSGGFYGHLVQHMELMKKEGFLYSEAEKRITIIDDPDDLKKFL
ncbi:MAG TPA: TIGR00730 family Rossman fold protein [Chitinophagaceae bacterium]|nr:TIGR00730 family Rossman fold protein [Chitinophagaceae bacterium]HRX94941.1 TIGR00730 family Rossman fold protein [Chitinophagaceae bacterium]